MTDNTTLGGGDCDVLVIGGGPAGSTTAALLAQKGWHVVLLEKDRHPRFHIGESLLPRNLSLFERLGVSQDIEQIGVVKPGAQFVSDIDGKSETFYFNEAINCANPYAYQVRRSEFDHILLTNCAAKGAEVHEQTRVTDVAFHPGDDAVVTARSMAGVDCSWKTRFVVDASGRSTFLANTFGIKARNRQHNSAAVFGHFAGAERPSGKDAGNISLYWFDHGWFWMIPLKDDIMSVGAVCWPYYMKSRKTGVEEFLMDTIALCPGVTQRLRKAKLISPATATGNYSYQAQYASGERFILVGDAFAFVDPVFSSGVLLAMNSAFVGSEVVHDCLTNKRFSKRRVREYDRCLRRGVKTFSWFIYRVTTPAMRHMFMHPGNPFGAKEGLITLLAGDIFDRTPIYWKILVFKFIYYVTSIGMWRESFASYKLRRRNAQSVA